MSSEYTVKDVAQLFGVQEARLRYWAQTGFVGPSVRRQGRFFYTFQDLIGVKVAKELLERGLSLQSVRKSLEALRAALPHVDRPLTQLRITADGDRVVVSGDDVPFEAHSGQVLMSFAVASLSQEASRVLPLATGPDPAPGPAPALPDPDPVPAPVRGETSAPLSVSAYAAFLSAVQAQDAGDTRAAEDHYRRALELDPALAAAWTNLASLLERRGARGDAREACEKAVALDPEQPEARYNLANLLADAGDTELAIAEYRRVASTCPEFADAHFNLGLALIRQGARNEARAHLARYLELDSESEWAGRARELLADLSAAEVSVR